VVLLKRVGIGDIHGCSVALAAQLRLIAPQPDDTIVPLGDYVDRGIDSKGVIDQLIAVGDGWMAYRTGRGQWAGMAVG
jgi:serine/threonine protein phosphatase 1